MSSTGLVATSSTSSNIQLVITSTLADYTETTGIDLSNSKNPFSAALEQANSPEAILQLLQEREKEFKEYRNGDRRLIRSLIPTVKAIQAFSGVLGEATGLVSHKAILLLF
jgi:fungal STAND N-terminal Goodbye domain